LSGDDRDPAGAKLSHLVSSYSGTKSAAVAAEPGHDALSLLGARGVDAADLDRFAVGVRMGGSLGDVVKTLVRLSP
jgi:hypothetical protein